MCGDSALLNALTTIGRIHVRVRGLAKGAPELSHLSAVGYSLRRRRWARWVAPQVTSLLPEHDPNQVISDYLRHEGYRHAHEVLSSLASPQRLGQSFVQIRGLRLLADVEPGRGAVLVGAHLGFLPWATFALCARRYPAMLVIHRAGRLQDDGRRSFFDCRFRRGYLDFLDDPTRVIPTGGAYSKIEAALRRGNIVCMMGDVGHRYAIQVPFFRSSRAFATGPYQVAQALDAPLFLYRLRPTGPAQYSLELGPPMEAHLPVHQLVRAFAEFLEAAIRDQPEAWCFLPWHLRPHGNGR